MTHREELLHQARTNPEALVDYILTLEQQVQDLKAELLALKAQVQTLTGRLALNSQNSSKPPSSDGYQKPAPKSRRGRSGRPSGGPPGHPGCTLQTVSQPDHVQIHPATQCACGRDLQTNPVQGYVTRQVFDLPEPKLEVTEHRAEIKVCACGQHVQAEFPSHVTAPVQYGPRVEGLLVYWRDGQLLPSDRSAQMFADLYGYAVSPATIEAARQQEFQQLQPFEQRVCELLPRTPVVHADESGLRVEGHPYWLHVASTPKLTFYAVHPRRGSVAFDAIGLLPRLTGRLIHDCLPAYWKLTCAHGTCNAHLLRELQFVEEQLHQPWVAQMQALLLEMHHIRKQQPSDQPLSPQAQMDWLLRYQALLQAGRQANPPLPPPQKPHRGRFKQTKPQNLLDRMEKYQSSVLAFLEDPRIPFTNNQAEQDIRMIKVQQKISGTFRTLQGAQTFARIRSYLSTVRKHGLNVFQMIVNAINGHPFLPPYTAPT
jgi:transposase